MTSETGEMTATLLHCYTMQIYLYKNDQQIGPFTEDQMRRMVASGEIPETANGWHEGLPEWQPLNTILAFAAPVAMPTPMTAPLTERKEQVVQTNVKQGAIIGGWVCFALGIGLMISSMWSFIIYGPLFLVAFILSIVAMSQRRVFGGVALLLTTLVVPAILGLNLFTTRTVKVLKDMGTSSSTSVTQQKATENSVDSMAAVQTPPPTLTNLLPWNNPRLLPSLTTNCPHLRSSL